MTMPGAAPFAHFAVIVGAPRVVGATEFGERRVVPITGGRVTGDRLTGAILPGGTDEQLVSPDGVTQIHARYLMRTDDGALIRVESQGIRCGPPDLMARLAKGERIDPAQIYFAASLRFETGAAVHRDLTRRLFISRGEKRPDHVLLTVWEVT